ncbi:MAG: class I SAM-dependent methyltransferase [Synechococcales cyanobacterium RM1_1_8]|nr:class I SAM-dependent methyltransferase [Synechococcales cyanobacterium RM1_1_8]
MPNDLPPPAPDRDLPRLTQLQQPIQQQLQQHIQQQPQHRITFADYMDRALYQPGGYYHQAPGIGPNVGPNLGSGGPTAGDFITSPHLCADFGELLAIQLLEMWEHLGRPQPFQIVEMGAGHGLLAVDILRYLLREAPQLARDDRPENSLDYRIIERSPSLQNSQRQQLQASGLPPSLIQAIRWHTWEDLPHESITGCFLSNELIDAFPVHLVEVAATSAAPGSPGEQEPGLGGQGPGEQGQARCLKEVYVTWDGDRFSPILGELSDPALADYFAAFAFGLEQYPIGYRTEINLAARAWIDQVANKLARGYCLTIDYGYTAERYYQPSRRGGTLQCYFQHSHHNDPFTHVGQQDITAHVNFTALEQWGTAAGLESLGFTQQGLFLMALGLGDRLQALATEATDIRAIQQMIQRREQLHQLINPMGLGNFGILIQAKGLSPAARALPLQG